MTRSELEEIDGFAHRHSLLVVSDEIHCELILEGRHIPYFTLNERAEQTSITLSDSVTLPGDPSTQTLPAYLIDCRIKI